MNPQPLTATELKVLACAAEGLAVKGTAEYLNLAVSTIRTHRQHILLKYYAENIAHAVAIGFREGVLPMKGGDA